MALIIFRLQDAAGHPLGGVVAQSVGGPGPWAATSNACGDMITNLQPAHYDITFSKPGYVTRELPADLGDCGIVTVGLESAAAALPSPPTRQQLCEVRCRFQGLSVVTQQYGPLPLFDPAIGWFALEQDRNACYDVKADVFDTHINLTISGQYHEPGTGNAYDVVPGRDYTQDLPALRALITEVILAGAARGVPNGFRILLAMAGDGMSVNPDPQPGEYNDPQGWTYGWQWLMRNFGRVWASLRDDGPDLTPWIIPMPGYDGVVPAWQPFTRVNDYVRMARGVVGPSAALAIELSSGYNSWSGEANDWSTEDGQMFDVILSEFPYQIGPPAPIPSNLLGPEGWLPTATDEDRAPFDQVWQIVGAMIEPFHRPANMPANDYPNGIPYRLAGGTPRGPFFYVAWEFDTFGWVRGAPWSQVQAHRNYLFGLGCNLVG